MPPISYLAVKTGVAISPFLGEPKARWLRTEGGARLRSAKSASSASAAQDVVFHNMGRCGIGAVIPPTQVGDPVPGFFTQTQVPQELRFRPTV